MTLRKTSSIVLLRPGPSGPEIFWTRRSLDRAFLGGFQSFFAGSLHASDADIPGVGGDAWLGCAARELFEEAGVLVLDTGLVFAELPGDDLSPGGTDWPAFRRAVCAEREDFAAGLARRGVRIDAARFVQAGAWQTPAWLGPNYVTEYYTLRLSADEASRPEARNLEALVQASEIERGEWVRPADALAAWRRGRVWMTTPIERVIAALATDPHARQLLPSDAGADRAPGEGPATEEYLEIVGGLRVLGLRTETLPPATHTNCFIIGGGSGRAGSGEPGALVVVDPGAGDPAEQQRLHDVLDALIAAGNRLDAVVLTHHHPDHVGGVGALLARYATKHRPVEVWAHEATLRLLRAGGALGLQARDDGRSFAGEPLEHEEVLELGEGGVELQFLHTPGHAPGHLAILHSPSNILLAGDLVTSQGTIVVDPPEGNMGDYLASLRLIAKVSPQALFPSHGWLVAEPAKLVEHYIAHRLERERRVYAALERASAAAGAEDLVAEVYADVPPAIWPLAIRSLEAHLEHLVAQGRATVSGGRYLAVRDA